MPRPHLEVLPDKDIPTLLRSFGRRTYSRLFDSKANSKNSEFIRTFVDRTNFKAEESLEALAKLIGPVSETKINRALFSANLIHEKLITNNEIQAASNLISTADKVFSSTESFEAQSRISRFLSQSTLNTPIAVIPYVISSECRSLYGCALQEIIVLCVHPHSNPIQLLGVVIHEAIHIVLQKLSSLFKCNDMTATYLEEAIATSLGSAWFVEQIGGESLKMPWYENKEIDELAKRLYPVLNEALKVDDKLFCHMPILIEETRRFLEAANGGNK